jgi:hypothetical protein
MSLSLPEPKPELEAKGSEKCSFPHCSLWNIGKHRKCLKWC